MNDAPFPDDRDAMTEFTLYSPIRVTEALIPTYRLLCRWYGYGVTIVETSEYGGDTAFMVNGYNEPIYTVFSFLHATTQADGEGGLPETIEAFGELIGRTRDVVPTHLTEMFWREGLRFQATVTFLLPPTNDDSIRLTAHFENGEWTVKIVTGEIPVLGPVREAKFATMNEAVAHIVAVGHIASNIQRSLSTEEPDMNGVG